MEVTEPELKFERFKTFLLEHASTEEERTMISSLSFAAFMVLASTFVTPHYTDIYRFASDPSMHTEEEAHKWVRDFVTSGKGSQLFASPLMLHQQQASAADIVKCVRYMEYFSRIIFERFNKPNEEEQ